MKYWTVVAATLARVAGGCSLVTRLHFPAFLAPCFSTPQSFSCRKYGVRKAEGVEPGKEASWLSSAIGK